MAFAERIREMAQSPQGARLFEEAAKLARDSRTRERIAATQRTLTEEHAAVVVPDGEAVAPRRRLPAS